MLNAGQYFDENYCECKICEPFDGVHYAQPYVVWKDGSQPVGKQTSVCLKWADDGEENCDISNSACKQIVPGFDTLGAVYMEGKRCVSASARHDGIDFAGQRCKRQISGYGDITRVFSCVRTRVVFVCCIFICVCVRCGYGCACCAVFSSFTLPHRNLTVCRVTDPRTRRIRLRSTLKSFLFLKPLSCRWFYFPWHSCGKGEYVSGSLNSTTVEATCIECPDGQYQPEENSKAEACMYSRLQCAVFDTYTK